jgi:hypothetical protein
MVQHVEANEADEKLLMVHGNSIASIPRIRRYAGAPIFAFVAILMTANQRGCAWPSYMNVIGRGLRA